MNNTKQKYKWNYPKIFMFLLIISVGTYLIYDYFNTQQVKTIQTTMQPLKQNTVYSTSHGIEVNIKPSQNNQINNKTNEQVIKVNATTVNNARKSYEQLIKMNVDAVTQKVD